MHQKPLVHIGMAKAASTFLQHEVFPKDSTLFNLGKHHVEQDLKDASMAIVRRLSINWNAETFGKPFRDAIAKARDEGRRPVYSEEDLSVFKFMDPETMAHRVREIFGPYDVLLLIRNPLSWLRSHYLFRVQHQNPIAAMGFEEWLETHLQNRRIGSDIVEIWFGALAEVYRSICGGQVHILPYELMKADKTLFAQHLSNILGSDKAAIEMLLNAPPKSAAHKIRITETAQQFFELFRWVVLRQPERAVSEILAFCATHAVDLPQDQRDALESLKTAKKVVQKDWAALFHKIGRKLPNTGEPANPVVPDQYIARIKHIQTQQLQILKKNFDFDLGNFSISYN